MSILTFLLQLGIFCHGVYGHTATDEIRLQKDLFTDYSPYVRPVLDSDDVVIVEIVYYLIQITGLDERTQVLKSTAWFDILWTDEVLSWDPSEYNYTYFTTLPITKIWQPDLVIDNSVSPRKGVSDEDVHVFILYTGEVYWKPSKELQTSCNVDVRKFPFDVQKCDILITQGITTDDLLTLESISGASNLIEFQENGEWHLDGLSQSQFTTESELETYVTLKYTIKLSRKPKHFLLNIIIPVIILSFLNCCSFLLPLESGEKISFCVTMFLSSSLFSTLIYDLMPQTSNNFSYLSLYLSYQQAAGAVTLVMEIVLLRTYFREGIYRLPSCIQKLEIKRSNMITALRDSGEASSCEIGRSEQDNYLITYTELARRLDRLMFVVALCTNSFAIIVLFTLIIQ